MNVECLGLLGFGCCWLATGWVRWWFSWLRSLTPSCCGGWLISNAGFVNEGEVTGEGRGKLSQRPRGGPGVRGLGTPPSPKPLRVPRGRIPTIGRCSGCSFDSCQGVGSFRCFLCAVLPSSCRHPEMLRPPVPSTLLPQCHSSNNGSRHAPRLVAFVVPSPALSLPAALRFPGS